MKNLRQYVEQKNRWNALFKGSTLSLQSAQDRQRIAQMIDSDLSPEHLTCDGELSRAEVNRRYRELTAAARQLIELDPATAKFMYEFA
jgi:hypothetical protein